MAKPPVHCLTRLVPFACDTTGKHPVPGLSYLERWPCLCRGLAVGPAGLVFDLSHRGQRIFFCYFHNVLRRYRRSPLGQYMTSVLGPGDVFVDVGANLGIYSYLARERGCDAWLFEPEARHAAFLQRNARFLGRVIASALAGVDQSARPFFVGGDSNAGASSLVMSSDGMERSAYSDVASVTCRRFDQVFANRDVARRLRLVKIDVEGAEDEVVQGLSGLASQLARQGTPIWCEVRDDTSDRNPGTYRTVCTLLGSWGYRPLVHDGTRAVPFDEAVHRSRVFDLLFST